MEGNRKQNVWKRVAMTAIFPLLAAALVFAASPVSAQAATKKVSATTNYKKAPAIKTGTTKVTAKKNNSYVKFTAPKTGTYTITISDIGTYKGSQTDKYYGNLYIKKLRNSYLSTQVVKTNGGKDSCLRTATKAAYDSWQKGRKVTPAVFLASRYGKLKLNKGETVYLQYYYVGNKSTYNLKVKRG